MCFELIKESEGMSGKRRYATINDWEGKVSNSLIVAKGGFLCKIELAYFSKSQQRNQDINTRLTQVFDLIEKPVTSAWASHDAYPPARKSLNGIQPHAHDYISFFCGFSRMYSMADAWI